MRRPRRSKHGIADVLQMKIAICKDTLANRRGADFAVMGLSEGLTERGHDVSLLERGEYMVRLKERLWDVVISAGTNELLDIAELFPGVFPFPVVQQFHTTPRSQFKAKRLLRNWRIRRALRRTAAIQVLCHR